MEKIEFSQDELKVIIACFNKIFQTGQIGIGDAKAIVPIADKVAEKIHPDPLPEPATQPSAPVFTDPKAKN